MQGVGFEPTHANIADLKSAPLDHSGNLAESYILIPVQKYFKIFIKLFQNIFCLLTKKKTYTSTKYLFE